MLPAAEDWTKEEAPADGVHTYGLYVEGARWDEGSKQLEESRPKVQYSTQPLCTCLTGEAPTAF
jgi:hypothetical protein